MRDIVRILVIVLLLLVSGRPAGAQANDWLEPFPPFRIAGNLYYVGSPNVKPGYKLVKNAAYPAIADDFTRTFETLAALPADLFLGAHGAYFGMEEKYAHLQKGDREAFVNREGYRKFVADKSAEFRAALEKQRAAGAK